MFKDLDHPLMIDFVEKASDVSLDDIVDILLLNRPAQLVKTLVWTPTWAVSITAVLEGLFIDWFQDPFDRQLNHLVLKAANHNGRPLTLPDLGI